MKKKILIALSLIVLIVGYSCQEDLEVVDPMSQDVGKGRLSVAQLDAESAKSLYEIMNNIVELPSWAEEEECNDSDCKQHAHSEVEIHSDSCKNDSCIHNLYGRMHNDSSNKQMRYKARSDLPELKKSNIRLEWDNAREWSDNKAKYVEVPLNVGGKLYALKKWKQKNEKKTQNERSKVECMFVFEQKHGTEQVNSYIVTLIGTKEYLKKNKEKVKGLRHKPNDGKFTGYVYKSDLNGHIKQGYGYTDGKITHKIFSGHVFRNKEVPENVTYLQMGLFDMAVNASSYSLGWEYYCPVCGNEHEMDDDGQCDYIIEYCRNCNQPVDECECCYSCGQYPCECCYNCGDYPCRCCYNCNQYPCQCCYVCGEYPCQCCKICKDYPCTCNDSKDCPNCGYDPCICCGVCHEYPCSCTPVAPPQDCPGPKCSTCGKSIGSSRSVSCPTCMCAIDLCNEIESFLENPGLYSIVTRGTVIPGPRPGPDYIFRLNKWVHINEIKDYSGLCYHKTVKKYYFNDAEMKEYLEECIDTYSFPLGGGVVAAAAVGYVSDKLFEKLCGYFERVGSFTLTCIGAFFDAHTETVEELYQDSYHKYTKTSEQGGYIIVTLVVESNGDLTSIYNMFEVFDAQGLPVDRFLY